MHKGLTNMGPAFRLAAEALAPGRIERRALRPALLLITDGLATDPPGGFEAGLATLMGQPAGRAALRLSIAIGRDAQSEALNRFIGDPERAGAGGRQHRGDRGPAGRRVAGRVPDVGRRAPTAARWRAGCSAAQDGHPAGIFSQDTII